MNPNERTGQSRPASAFDLASLEAELRHLPKPPVPTELEGRLVAAVRVPESDGQPQATEAGVRLPKRRMSGWGRFWIGVSAGAAAAVLVLAILSQSVAEHHQPMQLASRSEITKHDTASQTSVWANRYGGGRWRGRWWHFNRSNEGGTAQTILPPNSIHLSRNAPLYFQDLSGRGIGRYDGLQDAVGVSDGTNGTMMFGERIKGLETGLPSGHYSKDDVQYFPPGPDFKLGAMYNAINFGLPDSFNTEAYDRVVDNPFLAALDNPLSTFSIDVDTAAYANMRRFLTQGTLPPKGSVRIEELINYFSYGYAPPESDVPFSANVEIAECPWQPEHRLVRIGLKGREIKEVKRPLTNLVFLLDVSGSMQPSNKLPLLKRAMQMLVKKLGENDRVAIVVYAGASGLVLPSTTCDNQETILSALDDLQAGGSTNGGEGIQLAYDIAAANFIKGGVNRVILCTDGDFNVGITNQSDLITLIEKKAKSGVFLSVLGFGMGNLKDSTLEKLADKGNGNYGYIDTLGEAQKVLVDEMAGTLITIAKDMKIQIEFNPARVAAYRLIGYENRMLAAEDFDDDTKDAGEIGAGHTVTALYEIVPAGKEAKLPGVQNLKYQKPATLSEAAGSDEVLTLYLRYKQPDSDTSSKLEFPIRDSGERFSQASTDFKFAAAVASFGMLLRDSPYKGNATFDAVAEIAQAAKGADPHGYRAEFLQLIGKAKAIAGH